MLGRLPILRGIIVLRRTTLFCRDSAALLSNGVNLTDALRLMSELGVGGERLAGVIDRVRRAGDLSMRSPTRISSRRSLRGC